METIYQRPTIKTQPGQPTLAHTPRGFRVDFSPVADATRAPQINSRGFIVSELAMGAIGQGLESLGASGDKIQSAMAEAVNTRMAAEAEMTMQQAQMDIAAEIAKHPDKPEMWEGIAAKRTDEVQKMLMQKGLSPAAQRHIEIASLRWATNSVGETKVASIRRQFDLTGQTLAAAYKTALDNGDYDGAARAMEGAKPYLSPVAIADMEIGIRDRQKADADGFISAALDRRNPALAKEFVGSAPFTPSESERRLANIEGIHAVNIEKDQIQHLTLKDPAQAVAKLEAGEIGHLQSPGDFQAALVQAKQTQAAMARDVFQEIKTRIDLNQVPEDAKFEEGVPGVKQLTPLMRDVLKAYNADHAQKAARNNPEAFHKAEAQIESYEPKEGDDLERAAFEMALETNFTGPFLDRLKDQWKKKLEKPEIDITETGEAFKALNRWAFTEERLGKYKEPALDEKGRPILRKDTTTYVTKPGWLWGESTGPREDSFEPIMKEDAKKLDAVAAKVGGIKETIRREVKEGKLKDAKSVMARMAELAGVDLAAAAAGEVDNVDGPSSPILPPANAPGKIDLREQERRTEDIINYKPSK